MGKRRGLEEEEEEEELVDRRNRNRGLRRRFAINFMVAKGPTCL